MSAAVTSNLRVRTTFNNGMRDGGGWIEFDENSDTVTIHHGRGPNVVLPTKMVRALHFSLQDLFTIMAQQGVKE